MEFLKRCKTCNVVKSFTEFDCDSSDLFYDKTCRICAYKSKIEENKTLFKTGENNMAKKKEALKFKTCTKCKKKQGIDQYYAAPLAPDGFRSDCRTCFLEQRKKKASFAKKKPTLKTVGGQKECNTCHKTKPIKDYSLKATGSTKRRPTCKECIRVYQIKWRENKRAEEKGLPIQGKTPKATPGVKGNVFAGVKKTDIPAELLEQLSARALKSFDLDMVEKVYKSVKEYGPCPVEEILLGLWLMFSVATKKPNISSALGTLKNAGRVKMTHGYNWGIVKGAKGVADPVKKSKTSKKKGANAVAVKLGQFEPLYYRGERVNMKNGDVVVLQENVYTAESVNAISTKHCVDERVVVAGENILGAALNH